MRTHATNIWGLKLKVYGVSSYCCCFCFCVCCHGLFGRHSPPSSPPFHVQQYRAYSQSVLHPTYPRLRKASTVDGSISLYKLSCASMSILRSPIRTYIGNQEINFGLHLGNHESKYLFASDLVWKLVLKLKTGLLATTKVWEHLLGWPFVS